LQDLVSHLAAGGQDDGAEGELLAGIETGDDAAAVRVGEDMVLIATTDLFSPVVDDAYDWGRIAATNALSDVYAMGGRPVVALNLLGWPREILPMELAQEVLRGGADVVRRARCHLGGGHSVDAPEPLFGLAVTGLASEDELIRNDSGLAGRPLTRRAPFERAPFEPDQALGYRSAQYPAQGDR